MKLTNGCIWKNSSEELEKPKLTVIIITWNAKDFMEKCLRSIYNRNRNLQFELIIVDNNSQDGTTGFIKSHYPDVTLIRNSTNIGVAPARNQGLSIAKGKYVLILDVDTEIITENAFSLITDFMERNPKVGLAGAKLIYPDGTLQHTCRRFPSIWVKLLIRFERFSFIRKSKMMSEHYMSNEDHDNVLFVDYVIGAFQLIRKSLLDEIGHFDENIFYGPEDIDFCLRAKKKNYKIVYFPHVVLYHFYQRITRSFFSKVTYSHVKGLIHFFLKHKYLTYPKY